MTAAPSAPAVLTADQVRRRFLVLTATRWLPTGLLVPLITIATLQRGIPLAQIGLLTAVGAAVVLTLELPSGGLSDVLGRRPLLLVAAAFSLASTGLQVFATTFTLYAAAWAVEGVDRALDSGPLESWYVDAALAADPGADIERGISQHSVVLSGAIAVGALLSGALALAPQPAALPVLALPLVVSFALRALDTVAVALLLEERRPERQGAAGGGARSRPAVGAGLRAARAAVAETRTTVVAAIALLRTRRALLALVLTELLWGAGMVGVEVFSGPRLVDLLGDGGQAVLVLALVAALSWSLSAVGARAAPWLARRTGSWVAAAVVSRAVQGGAVLLAGVVAGLPGLLSAYVGSYLVHGAANVAHSGLLHRNVEAARRATVVSINSLASRLGGLVSAPLLGALGAAAGLPWVFVVSAVLLAAGAPLYLAVRAPVSAPGGG